MTHERARGCTSASMLLLALGSVLLAFVSSASARGVLPSNVRGVNIHFAGTGNPNEVAMLARGFAMVRMDLSWQATEVAPSVYNFTQYDILYDTLNAQDVQLWLILDYTNPIYCPNGTSPITPAQQAAFARWSAAAAVHFQPRNPAVIFEIYNEPVRHRSQTTFTRLLSQTDLARSERRVLEACAQRDAVCPDGTGDRDGDSGSRTRHTYCRADHRRRRHCIHSASLRHAWHSSRARRRHRAPVPQRRARDRALGLRDPARAHCESDGPRRLATPVR